MAPDKRSIAGWFHVRRQTTATDAQARTNPSPQAAAAKAEMTDICIVGLYVEMPRRAR
jgi:hypothetical protein